MKTKATPTTRHTGAPSARQARALKLWVVLARAHAAILRHADADVARDGLTLAEFAILEALLHKGRLRAGELQQKVLVTSGGTTYLVDRLVTRGLVRRVDCPDDRRIRYVELTPKGTALVQAAFARHTERITQVLDGLTAEEQELATRLVKKLGLATAQRPVTSDA